MQSTDQDLSDVTTFPRLQLSAAQRSIVDAQMIDPDSDVFVVADRVEITGEVSTLLLARAIEDTVAETEALGVVIGHDEETGEPHRLAVPPRVRVRVHDVAGEPDPQAAAETLIGTELARGARGLRAAEPVGQLVVRTGPDRVLWLMRYHHVAVDGYAISLIARQVAERYRLLARATGAASGTAPEAAGPAFGSLEALVAAEEAALADADASVVAGLLERVPAALGADGGVPTVSGRSVPALRRAVGVEVPLSAEAAAAVAGVSAQDRRITWADVHTAAYAAFAARAAGTGTVVLGVPFAARTTREAARTPSMSVTVLPLPVRVDPAGSLLDLARRVGDDLAVLRRAQALRGERLAAGLGVPSLLRGPGINLKPYTPALDFGTATGVLRTEAAGPVDDLDLSVVAGPQGISLRLDANPDAYGGQELQRVAARYRGFLERLLEDPARPLGRVPVLPPGEPGAEGSEPLPEGGFDLVDVSDALVSAAGSFPEEVAVRCGDETITFAALHGRVRSLAAHLRGLGAVPESVVAIALPRGIDLVVSVLAVLEAGAALTPVDLGYPAERIEYLLADSNPVVVLTAQGTPVVGHPRVHLVDAAAAEVPGADRPAAGAAESTPPRHDPAALAYVVYTSGSTGRPKGVGVTRGALAFFLAHHAATLFRPTAARAGRRLRAAHTASFSFDSSWEQLLWLLLGHELVVFDEDDRRDARAVVEAIDALRIDTLDVTPSFATGLVDAGLLETAHTPELFLIGGEAVPAELWRKLAASPLVAHNYYGPTEATVDALGAPVVGERPTIGRALEGTDALVLDHALQPVSVGVEGELYLGGPHLARGYQGRPGLTASRFVADPRGGGRRLYRTGDVVRVEEDGTLSFLGRSDDQVKIRGHRVELSEVGDALARLDGVAQAVAVARWTRTGTRLLAYAVPDEGTAPDPAELLARLRDQLPEHLVPHAIGVVGAFPLTSHGKLDAAALPEPGSAVPGGRAPETDRERAVCSAIGEVLGLVDVPVDVDVVTLGGDSIAAIGIISVLRRAGWVARPRDLFAARTSRGLAALLQPVDAAGDTAARPRVPACGRVPATPVVRDLERLSPNLAAVKGYAQSTVLTAPGLHRRTLVSALRELSRRYPVLHLTATEGRDGWELEIPAPGPSADDPSAAPFVLLEGPDAEALRARLVDELDPAAGRVLAVGLCHRDNTLVLAAHHLVVDGVSWRTLTRALGGLLSADTQVDGPGATVEQDAQWRGRALALEALAPEPGEEAHWRSLARTTCSVFPGPVPVTPAGRVVRTVRGAGAAAAAAVLETLPRALDARPDTVLAGALAAALRQWRGVEAGQLLLEWETHGRDPLYAGEDVADGLGWFTTEFPVAIELAPSAGAPDAGDPGQLAEAVRAARQARAEAPHDGLGADAIGRAGADPTGPVRARPGVLLNYLGRFAGEQDPGAPVRLAGGRPFEVHLPAGLGIGHAIEVAVFVSPADAGLEVEWTFAPELADEAQAVLEAWDRALSGLVELAGRAASGPGARPTTLIPAEAAVPGLDAATIRAVERRYGPIVDIAPLSPMQEGLLFHALKNGDQDVYLTSTTVELETVPHADGRQEPVDVERIAQAVRDVVAAHPQLGAAFVVGLADRPVQLVPRRPAVEVTMHDGAAGRAAARATLEVLQRDELARRVDVARPPLLRAHVVRTGEATATLLLAAHHLLLDGWSTPLLIDRILDAAESAPAAGAGWPALRRAILAQARREDAAARRAWGEHLQDVVTGTLLGGEQTGPVDTATVPVPLPTEDGNALLQAARAAGLTISTVLTGAWAHVVARYLGRTDVVVGVTTAGRGAAVEDVAGAVGLLSTTVPARFRMRADEPFGRQLRRLQAQRAELQEFESLPLSDIEAVAGAGTLFDTLVVVENYPAGAQGAPGGLRIAGIDAAGATHYAVGITLLPGSGVRIELDHDAARVPDERARGLAAELAAVLSRLGRDLDATPLALPVPAGPGQACGDVLVGPEPERTPQDGSGTCAVLRSLMRVSATAPDAVSVRFRDRAMTARELTLLAGGIQAALEQALAGAGEEPVAALALPRGVETVAAIVACLAAGATYLPLDAGLPAERAAALIADAGAAVVLAPAGSEAAGLAAAAGLAVVDPEAAPPRPVVPRPVPGSAAAYIIYTSGSTGRPKGVVISRDSLDTHFEGLRTGRHAELVARLARREGRGRVVAVHSASFSFDTSLIQLHWMFAGHELVVLDEDERRDPALFAARARTADVIDVAPVLAEQLVSVGLADGERPLPEMFLGGEAVTPELWSALRARADRTRALNLYGPTETTVDALGQVVDQSPRPLVGIPVAGITATVLDPWLRSVPRGTAGELYLSGGQLARGYLGRPGLTAASFVAGPDGQRRYRTGDLVRVDAEGRVEYLGRLDDQLKISGYRIEPGEVETALRAVPGVAQAAAFADASGSVTALLFAAVTGEGLDATAVRDALAAVLPHYLVPSLVLVLGDLPLTTSGKVDKAALRALAAGRGAGGGRVAVPPSGPAEVALVAAVAQVLGTEVSADDDFFRLGGHSLTALRVIGALLAAGWSLGVADVFGLRGLRRIAAAMVRTAPSEAGTPAADQPGPAAAGTAPAAGVHSAGPVPVSRAQRRLLFLAEAEGVNAAYTVPVSLGLAGPVDAGRLAEAWAGVVERHPVLRTVYRRQDGGFCAEVLADPPPSFVTADLGAQAGRDAVEERVAEEEARAFDLFLAPPVRATLVSAGERRVLVLAAHHIAVDETSFQVILEDLSTLLAGEEPEPAAPFAGFAAAEAGADPEALARWTRRLAGIPTELELPTDRPRPARSGHGAETVSAPVPAELAGHLARFAAEQGVTPLMVLQTAVATLWQALGAGDDIVLGTPVATRSDARFARTVGYLVNTLPVRLDVSLHSPGDGPTFAELVARTRDSVLDALSDAQVAFDEIVDAVAPPRSLSRHPLFQTMVSVEQPVQSGLRIPGVTLTEREGLADAARFDLAVRYRASAVEGGQATLTLVASADLHDRAGAEVLLERLLHWLEQLASAPHHPVRGLEARLDRERLRPAVDSGIRAEPVPLLTAFAERAAADPDALALVAGGRRIGYGELAVRVLALRDALRRAGVGAEDRVAVATGRGPALVVALLGVLAAGAAYVPLDVDYPDGRLRMMLDDAAPALVLVDDSTRGAGRGLPELVLGMAGEPGGQAPAADPASAAGQLRSGAAPGGGAAYVIYTSGSTGRPKGVVIPRSALDAFVAHEAALLGLGAEDRLLSVTTVSFDIAALELYVPLVAGATVILADRAEVRDPERLTALVRREAATVIQATPSLWRPLLEVHPAAFANVAALVGGEALPAELAAALHRACRSVRNVYGPTEATVWATSTMIGPRELDSPAGTAMPIGVPFAGVQAHVLDGALRPVPDGVPGELYLSGGQLARGYLGRPDLTFARFVADPFGAPGGRLYRTGDLVSRGGNGVLRFLRRADDQVKVDGHRIELGEVEAALRDAPGVLRAAAVVRPGPSGRDRLLGYVAPVPGAALDGQTVRNSLAERLPSAHVPRVVTVVEEIPLTLNGKIARGALPEPAAADRQVRGPRTKAERAVVGAAAETLGLAEVSVDDAFFELGGDSISSIRLVALVRQRGFAITPGLVFAHEDLARLAAAAQPLTEAPARRTRRTRARISARDLGTIERLLEDPR